MNRYASIFLILVLTTLTISVHGIELEKKDYLALIVSNYVYGFNEFDMSVVGYEEAVSVGIYYDVSTQKENRAVQLSERFRKNIPKILEKYSWAKNIEVLVNVYSEDRTGRGYR